MENDVSNLTFPGVARRHPPHRLAAAEALLSHLGKILLLLGAFGRALLRPSRWWRAAVGETSRQMGDAFGLVILISVVGGALIAQQIGVQFQNNLPSWVIGAIVAATTITEITPLFTAFILIGVVGTRIAAEIGSMQVSEQLDALEVMGRDPVSHLVVPRIMGAVIAGPILMCFALAASLAAGWLASILATRATSGDFWFGVRAYMRDFPLFFALIKGFLFGFWITLLACYNGLEARGGSAGVGRATRSAVIAMIVGLLLLDAALVPLLKWVRI
jgi:phospholipid/cholesterol/gamma-HCH transport system permease protein